MTPGRRLKWNRANFAQLAEAAEALKTDFDIDLFRKVDPADIDHAALLFHRRHLHTHKGGVADQKYLDESGDKTVAVGQLVRETQECVHRLLSTLVKMGRNLHAGFHSIIPVQQEPIKYEQQRQALIAQYERQ